MDLNKRRTFIKNLQLINLLAPYLLMAIQIYEYNSMRKEPEPSKAVIY